MRIKKIQAGSISEALKQVRDELGENALILSTKTLQQDQHGEGQVVEVVAAVDELAGASGAGTSRPAGRRGKAHYATRIYQENSAAIRNRLPGGESLETEPPASKPAGAGGDRVVAVNHPVLIKLLTSLKVAGVHTEVIRRVITRLNLVTRESDLANRQALQRAMIKTFAQFIRVSRKTRSSIGLGEVMVLVGPTGVGKTTTIAKIAAKLKIEAKKSVGLISIDTFRIAAIDQLKTFAHLAELPLQVAYTPGELREAVDNFRHMDYILIDTTGRSPRDETYIQELQGFLTPIRPDKIHLVLSATTRFAELEEIIHRYGILAYNSLIFTKVDEVMHPAVILNLYKLATVPIGYITNGQNIPDDIIEAEAETIARYIVHYWDFTTWIN